MPAMSRGYGPPTTYPELNANLLTKNSERQLSAALASAKDFGRRLSWEADRSECLKLLIHRVELRPDLIVIELTLAPLVAPIKDTAISTDDLTITREVPLRIKRRGVEMRLVIEGERAATTKADPTLLKEIKRAHRCFDALLSGRASIAELAEREGVDDRYVSTVLPLAFLAPDIVEAIVAGTQPADLNATTLVRRVELALDWPDQKRQLGFA